MKAKITIQFQIPYTNKFIEKDSILEVINKAPEGAVVYYKEMYVIIPYNILQEINRQNQTNT